MWKRFRDLISGRNAPRRLKVTPLGRMYLVLTIGIGVGALNTGNNLLYLVLGFLLSVIVMSGVLSERVIWRVQVRRVLPDGVFAHEPFALRYEVSVSDGRAFALKVQELDTPLGGWAWAPFVVEGEPVIIRADGVAPKRGPLTLKTIEVTTSYPMGLFEKSRTLRVEDHLLVYPRRGFACEMPDANGAPHSGDGRSSRFLDGTGELAGLKDVAPNEDARRVHWKKSAAAGKLVRPEREREDRRQFMLKVEHSEDAAEIDRRCEEVAAMTAQLLHNGHEVGLQAGQRRIRPAAGGGHEKRILSALAWVGHEETQSPP